MDDAIKGSFLKVKQDMQELRGEIQMLKEELQALTSLVKSSLLTKSSTGNDGVPTDRQTDRQTDNTYPTHQHIPENDMQPITDLVNSLKIDLKRKFKSLTKQEFHIFSILFTVDKTQEYVTYKDLAARIGLTESSVRDYIIRIMKKGIPIIKEKLNNKTTILKIPADLKNIATLESLLKLRNAGIGDF